MLWQESVHSTKSSNYANLYFRIYCCEILDFIDFAMPLYVQKLERQVSFTRDARRREGMFSVIWSDSDIFVHKFHNN